MLPWGWGGAAQSSPGGGGLDRAGSASRKDTSGRGQHGGTRATGKPGVRNQGAEPSLPSALPSAGAQGSPEWCFTPSTRGPC